MKFISFEMQSSIVIQHMISIIIGKLHSRCTHLAKIASVG